MFNNVFAETYSNDYYVIEKLGLRKFKILRDSSGVRPRNIRRYLGTVHITDTEDRWSVRVYVEALPAQFYEFSLTNKRTGQKLQINTGSGSFRDHWNSIGEILNGMMVIKELKARKEQ